MSRPATGQQGVPDQSPDHYYWLDWLRFSAAFEVLLQHWRIDNFVDNVAPGNKALPTVLNAILFPMHFGQEAVILFFVLSGFLVGGRSTQRALAGSFNTVDYAIDRVTRVYVALVPALVLTGALVLLKGGHVSLRDFFGNLAGLQTFSGDYVYPFGDNGSLWTLAYEVWFYTLWGGLLTLWVNQNVRVRFVAWLAVLFGFGMFTRLEAVYLFWWVLGALAFVCKSSISRKSLLVAGLSCAGLGMVLSKFSGNSADYKSSWVHGIFSHEFCLLVLSVGICFLVKTLCTWPPVSRIGRTVQGWGTPLAAFSYTLYLVHQPLLFMLGPVSRTGWGGGFGMALLQLPVVLFLSWVVYWLFERNTARVRRWWKKCLGPAKPA